MDIWISTGGPSFGGKDFGPPKIDQRGHKGVAIPMRSNGSWVYAVLVDSMGLSVLQITK